MKDYDRIARKTTLTLFAAQSLVSAALIVSGTVSTIVAVELSGKEAWAGVPSAVQRLGTAFAALAVGANSIFTRRGRCRSSSALTRLAVSCVLPATARNSGNVYVK